MGRRTSPRHEHAVRRRRAASSCLTVYGRRRPDRDRLQRRRRLPRPRRRPDGAGALHLRLRGRDDPRLGADRSAGLVDAGAGHGRLRCVGRAVPRPRARARPPVRDRLPQRPRADVRFANWRPVRRRGRVSRLRRFPAWYAPFGIAAFGDRVFVTYAYPAPVNGNDAPSGGYVDEFDLDGRLVARVGHTSELDQPWGLALAPEGFGRLGGDLLVANFGSERINVYATQGQRLGVPRPASGQGPRRLGDRLRRGGRRRQADDALLRSRPAPLARRRPRSTSAASSARSVRVRRTRTRAPRARPARRSAAGTPLDPRSARSPSQRRASRARAGPGGSW